MSTLFDAPAVMTRDAVISSDERYRYWLLRRWAPIDSGPTATFVMLNPSTADADIDDPTIRRCIGFARAWGCSGLTVLNLYALRATDPRELWKVDTEQAVGPENDVYLHTAAGIANRSGSPLVAAWGANAKPDRVARVWDLLAPSRVGALGFTKAGQPRHPLYLPVSAPLTEWAS